MALPSYDPDAPKNGAISALTIASMVVVFTPIFLFLTRDAVVITGPFFGLVGLIAVTIGFRVLRRAQPKPRMQRAARTFLVLAGVIAAIAMGGIFLGVGGIYR